MNDLELRKARRRLKKILVDSDTEYNKRIDSARLVYDLGTCVAKLGFTQTLALNEYEIGQELFSLGFPVPKMFDLDIYPTPLIYTSNSIIFMEKINGQSLYTYLLNKSEEESKEEEYKKNEEYQKIIEKVCESGFIPKDISLFGNTMIEHDTGRIILIDFEYWEYKPRSQAFTQSYLY
ncbi:MAG: hypothetical protein ABIF40_00815 [archaeon]